MEIKKISILLFSILIITIGGFLVWENNQNIEISKIEQAEIQEQIQNKEEKIDTSSWKTYKNEKYGFEVKYPQDWEYDLIDGVTFGDKKNCERDKIDEYWCESYISFIKSEKNPRVNNEKSKKDVAINVLNVKSIVYNTKNKLTNGSTYDEYYFIDNRDSNYEWLIVLKYYDNEKEKQLEINILKEILKTFKLLY